MLLAIRSLQHLSAISFLRYLYDTLPESEAAGRQATWRALVQQLPDEGPLGGKACEADHARRLHHDLLAHSSLLHFSPACIHLRHKLHGDDCPATLPKALAR